MSAESITNPAATLVDADGMAVVGRTRHDLMGIRYEGGEGGNAGAAGGEGGQGGEGGEGGAGGTGTEGAPAGGNEPGNEPGEQNQPADGDEPWTDPAKAKAEIERLRRERGDERIQAKKDAAAEARAELLKDFQKLIDPNAADADTPTVETLTTALEASNLEARDAKFELAVYKKANADKIDAEKLTNSRSFFNATKDLNPADEGFAEKLTAAINAEVAKDSSLRLGAGRSGAEAHGGTGGQPTLTKEQFDAMPVEELTNLYRTNRPEYDRLSAL